ncbi:uncharacterized protein DEA37_0007373 [Paragonimus westermani]|uniref:Uncharacterized protein n=1 Tax=Paragonimus westermani TaxID=34504 RepID=A0A5J4NAB9_9TREM|nr:uncharacterized protein DEA37_0007373 [Paragonimus westermani]
MRFAHSKYKVLLQDWGIFTPTFFIADNPLEAVDSFTYVGSTISSACNVADEISARIAKARVAFSKLRHLWRRKDVRLSLKGRVYNACVLFILLYGSETWPVHMGDINRLSVFDHRCPRRLAHIKWADGVSNVAVHRRVFRNVRDARSIGQPHHDGPLYYPVVATINLGSYGVLDFYKPIKDIMNSAVDDQNTNEVVCKVLLFPCTPIS